MAALTLATAILALEAKLLPDEIILVTDLVNKIKAHKKPKAAIVAAAKAVDSTTDDSYPYPGEEN